MGGIIVPNTKISGAVGNPGIPLADSPVGGFYETANGGVGISLLGDAYLELDQLGLTVGYKPPQAFAFANMAGSPIGAGNGPYGAAVSPDGSHLVVTNFNDLNISVFSINSVTGALTAVPGSPFANGLKPTYLVFSPDGKYILVSNWTVGISVYSINSVTGALTAVAGSPFATSVNQTNIAISPNGAYVFVSHQNPATVISVYSLNAATGALTAVAGSPFATGLITYGIAVSPDGSYLLSTNFSTNNVNVYSINAATGALAAVAGSPFATGVQPYSVAIYDGYAFVANEGSNNISVFSLNAATGALTAVAGSPFATGAGPFYVAVSAGYVYVANNTSNSLSVFSLNAATGALTAVAGSPFATGLQPICIATSSSGYAFVPNNTSNTLSIFSTSAVKTFNLIRALFDSSGKLGGSIEINGLLRVAGQTMLNQDYADGRYAALAGLITQVFSAKQLTLDHAAGGLIGTPAADNAIAGAVGEYIESIVLLAAAVNLATGVTANVTSIALTAGDWDVEGVISFHGDGTTNINDVQVGTNNAAAAFGGVGTSQSDYLTIVVAAGIDATYIAPKRRFSLAAPATVYLVALAHFTVSTCTAYGKISARRVR